jgi:hypothetical protein
MFTGLRGLSALACDIGAGVLMRFAVSVVGFIVSAALFSLACVYAFVATQFDASILTRAMWFTVLGLATAAVAINPLIHAGRSGLAVAAGVGAGLVVAFGFVVLSYLELVGFRP